MDNELIANGHGTCTLAPTRVRRRTYKVSILLHWLTPEQVDIAAYIVTWSGSPQNAAMCL